MDLDWIDVYESEISRRGEYQNPRWWIVYLDYYGRSNR